MKTSIFVAAFVPRTCPKCYTLVRTSDINAIAQRTVNPPFIETDWLYHVTSIEVAKLIKVGGLRSALLRTGQRTPDPKGSFARDRVKRIQKMTGDRLKTCVIAVMRKGLTPDEILGSGARYVPFNLMPSGSNDDYIKLAAEETTALARFFTLTRPVENESGEKEAEEPTPALARKPLGRKAAPRKVVVKVDASVAEDVATRIGQMPQHYLTQLALQYETVNFDIEGAITSSHVYFLNPRNALMGGGGDLASEIIKDGFDDYTKLREKWSTVILRVRRSNVTGLHQDEADQRAIRTADAVPARVFEIMTGSPIPAKFKELAFRREDNNWTPLLNWTA